MRQAMPLYHASLSFYTLFICDRGQAVLMGNKILLDLVGTIYLTDFCYHFKIRGTKRCARNHILFSGH